MSKLCLIYSIAPLYREAIFKTIDDHFDCDWYFGKMDNDIKELDYSTLKSVSFFQQIGNPSKLFWKKNLGLLFSRKYKVYLTLLESRAVSDYVFLALKKLFFPHKKIYIWTHGLYGKETGFESVLKKWQFTNVAGIFVYSNYSRDLLIQNGISQEKVFTIHNSLHYDQQKSLRGSLSPSNIYLDHFGNGLPVLVFVGRLTRVKQLDLLLDALSYLKEQGIVYNLVFVGDGSERINLSSKVQDLSLQSQVWFYGACYDEKINAELIYNADICVAPGNVGLTAMHSMVFGTPVISHDDFSWQMPEFESIRPGETGAFFKRGNVQSLADTIHDWIIMKEGKREIVRQACFDEIDSSWTPSYQLNVLKKHITL